MLHTILSCLAFLAATLLQPEVKQETQPAARPSAPPATAMSPLSFKMKLIDGKEQDLAAYKGKVVIIVNVASKCGYTAQYEHLEALYKAKKDAGLVILGFPANNFGGQEPGTNEEVAKFCKDKFGVTFPMFEKISVKGDDAHPLYKSLAALPAPLGGEPKWNFTKFIIARDGAVVARFDAKKRGGLEDGLVEKIDELLAAK